MGHEKMQQALFGWPDLDRVLAREYAMRGDIDPQPSCLDIAFGGFFVGAAHYRAATGHQLARREWLDHVVIDAGIQPRYPGVFLATCGQHDDRPLAGDAFRAPAAAPFDAAGPRRDPL